MDTYDKLCIIASVLKEIESRIKETLLTHLKIEVLPCGNEHTA